VYRKNLAKSIYQSNNLSMYKKEGKYGYIDKKGVLIIAAFYDYSYSFVNDIA
jgi:hypothetical protein